MRRITVSVLSIFIALPAFSATRLPVVNIGAAGVSARDAFGEGATAQKVARADTAPAVTVAPAPKKAVVARNAKKTSTPVPVKKAAAPSVDAGEKIAAIDVLSPRRPSSDLWAKNDAPLRMPTADEISVVRADYDLPEESLDSAPRKNLVARADSSYTDSLDAEIEKLVELQRRADASVAAPKSASNDVVARRADTPAPRVIAAPVAETRVADNAVKPRRHQRRPPGQDIALRRVVVPMESDVIVRTVEKTASPRIAAVRDDMTSMSPSELRKAFRKTYLSENKHLSTYQIDDRFDEASDMSASMEGFTARRDLSEQGGVRPLEIKIKFRGDDSALSRDNYNLLTEYAGIVVSNPSVRFKCPSPVVQPQTWKTASWRRAVWRLLSRYCVTQVCQSIELCRS